MNSMYLTSTSIKLKTNLVSSEPHLPPPNTSLEDF